jgi:hypothetical protein
MLRGQLDVAVVICRGRWWLGDVDRVMRICRPLKHPAIDCAPSACADGVPLSRYISTPVYAPVGPFRLPRPRRSFQTPVR